MLRIVKIKRRSAQLGGGKKKKKKRARGEKGHARFWHFGHVGTCSFWQKKKGKTNYLDVVLELLCSHAQLGRHGEPTVLGGGTRARGFYKKKKKQRPVRLYLFFFPNRKKVILPG